MCHPQTCLITSGSSPYPASSLLSGEKRGAEITILSSRAKEESQGKILQRLNLDEATGCGWDQRLRISHTLERAGWGIAREAAALDVGATDGRAPSPPTYPLGRGQRQCSWTASRATAPH